MASKIKVDQIQTADGTGTIALQNQLSGMTTASLPTVTTDKLGTGAVLQVVSAASASEETTTSSSFQESGVLTVNITPASTSSKFWIVASFEGYNNTASSTSFFSIFRLISGGADTNLGGSFGMGHYRGSSNHNEGTIAMNYLDSPNTTTALTYRVKLKAASGTAYLNKGAGASKGSITVMEIAG